LCAAAIHNATCYGSLRSETDELEAAHRGLEERNQAAERDLEVHDALTRIAMEGEDVDVVVRTVASLTSSPAAIVTDDGRVLSAHAPARGSGQKLHQRLQQWVSQDGPASSPNGEAVTVEEQGSWMLVVPVRAVGVTFGHLGLALVAPPTSGDRRAAEQAAVVSALLLAREEANVAAARRLQSEFVWDLLDGRLPDSVEAGVRARHLGAGFHLPARIAAIEASGLAESATSGGWSAEHLERARANLSRLIAQQLEDAGIRGAVLARRADLFAAVLPRPRGDGEKGLRRLTEALTAVNWPAGVTARVGVSSPVEHVGGFPEAWREARLALSAATTEAPGLFEELGVLQFLLAPTSRAELDLFARRHLGPLLAYDTEHGTGLMRTLETYLATGGSTRRAAELLNVHHRTVSYRLQRVEDLTGLHLDDQDDRLHVQLAAKILALEARPTDPR
jgi:sugar diacid utilization regulator